MYVPIYVSNIMGPAEKTGCNDRRSHTAIDFTGAANKTNTKINNSMLLFLDTARWRWSFVADSFAFYPALK